MALWVIHNAWRMKRRAKQFLTPAARVLSRLLAVAAATEAYPHCLRQLQLRAWLAVRTCRGEAGKAMDKRRHGRISRNQDSDNNTLGSRNPKTKGKCFGDSQFKDIV